MILVQWLPPTKNLHVVWRIKLNQSQHTSLVTGPVITLAQLCPHHAHHTYFLLLWFAFFFLCGCVCNSLRQLLCLENPSSCKSKNSMSLVPINLIFHHSHVLWTDPWLVFGNMSSVFTEKSNLIIWSPMTLYAVFGTDSVVKSCGFLWPHVMSQARHVNSQWAITKCAFACVNIRFSTCSTMNITACEFHANKTRKMPGNLFSSEIMSPRALCQSFYGKFHLIFFMQLCFDCNPCTFQNYANYTKNKKTN